MMWMQAAISLLFVLGLIALCAWIMRKFLHGHFRQNNNDAIKVTAGKLLDNKRKVVSINYQDKSYLMLLSAYGDVLLDSKKEKE